MSDGIYVRVKYRDEICFEQKFRAISGDTIVITVDDLIAEKVAAERNKMKWNSIHSCHADCQNPACVIVREAVAAERDECAKVCGALANGYAKSQDFHALSAAEDCEAAIRHRGQE